MQHRPLVRGAKLPHAKAEILLEHALLPEEDGPLGEWDFGREIGDRHLRVTKGVTLRSQSPISLMRGCG